MKKQRRRTIHFTCREDAWQEFRKKSLEKGLMFSYYLEQLILKEIGW